MPEVQTGEKVEIINMDVGKCVNLVAGCVECSILMTFIFSLRRKTIYYVGKMRSQVFENTERTFAVVFRENGRES